MLRLFVTTTFLWSLFTLAAAGEIYRYTDKDGVLRYTDDIAKVPQNMRDRVKKYEEIQSVPSTESQTTQPADPQVTPPARKKPNPAVEEQKEVEKQIAQRKKELEEEYEALIKEKEILDRETRNWQIRYNTRKRKSVARGKLMELKEQEVQWQEKYKAYEDKKKDLKVLENMMK
jgi:hypothetical protein